MQELALTPSGSTIILQQFMLIVYKIENIFFCLINSLLLQAKQTIPLELLIYQA